MNEIERLKAKYLKDFLREPRIELDSELMERVKRLRLPDEEEDLLLQLVALSEEETSGTGKKILAEYEKLSLEKL